MIIIDNVLISDEIITEHFVCNLNACKGACCKAGDYGAPLTSEEIERINTNREHIAEEIPARSKELLRVGFTETYSERHFTGTALHDDGSCIFLTTNELGIHQCGIEISFNKGKSSIKKPLSCELYPIRVTVNEEQGFEAWNYDQWDICSSACKQGIALKIPIYKFLEKAITRAKGQGFYEQLNAAAIHLSQS